jgi:hypothetical protein
MRAPEHADLDDGDLCPPSQARGVAQAILVREGTKELVLPEPMGRSKRSDGPVARWAGPRQWGDPASAIPFAACTHEIGRTPC